MGDKVVRFRGPPLKRVVVTFPLRRRARERLIGALGERFEFVDIKVSAGDEEVVLVPSASRHLVGKIRAAFPAAAVLVVEVEDADLGVQLEGQVLRSLDAGADGYFVARSVDELASIVDRAASASPAEESGPAALSPGADEDLSAVLDALLRTPQESPVARTPEC